MADPHQIGQLPLGEPAFVPGGGDIFCQLLHRIFPLYLPLSYPTDRPLTMELRACHRSFTVPGRKVCRSPGLT